MEWGETAALATATLSLAAALAYGIGFAAREVKGAAGAGVKTASTALLAALALAWPLAGGFWAIPAGLALGALGDLFLALGGVRRFLLGVAAFGLGHLAYAGALLWRSADLGFDGLSGGGRPRRWSGWPPCFCQPKPGWPRARASCASRSGPMSG
jgi:hypothetical protein